MKKSKTLIIILFVLCMLDLVFTVLGIEEGYLEEGNPLLNAVYGCGALWFVAVKLLFSLMACLFLGHMRHRVRWMEKVLYVPVAAYTAVVIFHFYLIGKVMAEHL